MRFRLGSRANSSSSLALHKTKTSATTSHASPSSSNGGAASIEYELQWQRGKLPFLFSDELGDDLPPMVSHFVPAIEASRDHNDESYDNQGFARVAIGHLLIQINHKKTTQLGFGKSMKLMSSPRFPVVLRFRIPMSRVSVYHHQSTMTAPSPLASQQQHRQMLTLQAAVLPPPPPYESPVSHHSSKNSSSNTPKQQHPPPQQQQQQQQQQHSQDHRRNVSFSMVRPSHPRASTYSQRNTTSSSVESTLYMPNDLRFCEPPLQMKRLASRESTILEHEVCRDTFVRSTLVATELPPCSNRSDASFIGESESARERSKRNQFSVTWESEEHDQLGGVVFKRFSAIQDIPIVELIVDHQLLLSQGQTMDMIQLGDALIGINNRNTKKLGFETTLKLLATTTKPCVLRFQRPSSKEDRRQRRARRQLQQSMAKVRSMSCVSQTQQQQPLQPVQPPPMAVDQQESMLLDRRDNRLFQSEIQSKLDYVPLRYVKEIYARAHQIPMEKCIFRGHPLPSIHEHSAEACLLRVYAEKCYRQSRDKRKSFAQRRQTFMGSSSHLPLYNQPSSRNRMEADRLLNLFVQRDANGNLTQSPPEDHYRHRRYTDNYRHHDHPMMAEDSVENDWEQCSSHSVFLDNNTSIPQEPRPSRYEPKLSCHSSQNSTFVGSCSTGALLAQVNDASWPMLGSILSSDQNHNQLGESMCSEVLASSYRRETRQQQQQQQTGRRYSFMSTSSFAFDDDEVILEDQTSEVCSELRASMLDELNRLTVKDLDQEGDQNQDENDFDDGILEVISDCSTAILLGDIRTPQGALPMDCFDGRVNF